MTITWADVPLDLWAAGVTGCVVVPINAHGRPMSFERVITKATMNHKGYQSVVLSAGHQHELVAWRLLRGWHECGLVRIERREES